jgi:hypothetical protein
MLARFWCFWFFLPDSCCCLIWSQSLCLLCACALQVKVLTLHCHLELYTNLGRIRQVICDHNDAIIQQIIKTSKQVKEFAVDVCCFVQLLRNWCYVSHMFTIMCRGGISSKQPCWTWRKPKHFASTPRYRIIQIWLSTRLTTRVLHGCHCCIKPQIKSQFHIFLQALSPTYDEVSTKH